jgi:hypothetical protein
LTVNKNASIDNAKMQHSTKLIDPQGLSEQTVNTLSTAMVVLGSMLLFSACTTSFPSNNMDPAKNNQGAYSQDLKECKEDYPQTSSGTHIRQWISCMNLKGWK